MSPRDAQGRRWRLDAYWQARSPVTEALRPLSWVFCLVARLRASAYRSGVLASRGLPVPVLVVGNISVGGTGKTPLVIWLVRRLQAGGRRPGVLTRGYRGGAARWPRPVHQDSDPRLVGDEAVLLARRCRCPVVAGPDRVAGGRMLVWDQGCDLVLCDDGLQHYALRRDVEIAVVDGTRRLGNGLCLPAGPLREPAQRLEGVDLVVVNGPAAPGEWRMSLRGDRAVHLGDPRTERPLEAFRDREVAAVAGIGNPERFFAMLREQGLRPREIPFPDHHPFCPEDFAGLGGLPVLMTEKDAVKCEPFLGHGDNWYVPVETLPEPALVTRLERLMAGMSADG
jgi:tetraacyldisaccharide 4'-kinase